MSKLFGKSYKEIGEKDLNEFSSGISERMMLFDGEFPSFLPHLIKEIVNHPNINQMDKEHLETYSDMFDLRWREDSSKPLLLSPIYTSDSRKAGDDLERGVASEKMRRASIPYIDGIKEKFNEY
mmetsp:Transcript_10936/g.9661  ORF Transcript_10936/g.9661 Transcript_10936/m.9661 type:complete len:124 (-) Transcript_10936:28-399(-)